MTEEATIRRGARNARYTTVPNHVFEDVRLSMEARWLLGYLLSKPDNWTVRMGDIRKKGGCGRDKARAMVTELVDAGYMEREDARKAGKFNGLQLVIYDEPQGQREAETDSVASLPQTEKPATVEPATANPPLVNTEDLAIPESSKDPLPSPLPGGDEGETIEDPKRIEERFWRTFKVWPHFEVASKARALRRWNALSPSDRRRVEQAVPLYMARLEAKKRYAVSMANFLDQRDLWPEPAAPVEPTAVEARPFGPLWGAVRAKALLGQPAASPAPTGAFMAQLLAQDDQAGRAERMRRQAVFGWPAVNRMHDAALNRRGVTVEAHLARLERLMEPVPVGSAMFEAWRVEHERRGWPWVPDPGGMPVVYFPAGGPEALGVFEAALLAAGEGGNEHADGDREAAE